MDGVDLLGGRTGLVQALSMNGLLPPLASAIDTFWPLAPSPEMKRTHSGTSTARNIAKSRALEFGGQPLATLCAGVTAGVTLPKTPYEPIDDQIAKACSASLCFSCCLSPYEDDQKSEHFRIRL
jgi:hypothetical protein